VSEAKVLPTKKGTYYGRITIEDFTDSYEFTLFGKDFELYRRFFYVGYPLMIKGRFNPSRFRQGELEFSIKSMHMLSDVREELVKKITLTLMLDEVTDDLIKDIKHVVSEHPGNVTLNFKLLDPESSIGIQLFSRTFRISVSNELVKHLNQMDINYKVN